MPRSSNGSSLASMTDDTVASMQRHAFCDTFCCMLACPQPC
jgi:hypothetical protein